MVEQNLKRLKQLFEAGVISTTEGQTSGRSQHFISERTVEAETTSGKAPEPDLAHEAKGGVL